MSRRSFQRRPALALVPPPAPEPENAAPAPAVSFCGHCGAEPTAANASSPTRVCAHCGLGLLLRAGADVAPAAGDAFVVIDDSLSVCAVSATAEKLLATLETEAVNQPITRLLMPAGAEGNAGANVAGASLAGANLAGAITWAARGDSGVYRTVVRPANTFGVRMSARIAACGPPRAALMVFE